jgi:6-phosphofructokinase 1
MKKEKNVLVAQSGGPTSVINATLSGVVKQSLESCEINKIYGLRHGIEGAIKGEAVDLTEILVDEESLGRLALTPGAALGSCRYKLGPVNEANEEYERIACFFDRHNIGYFFYIGGNDSMDTVSKLSKYFKMTGNSSKLIGIPKTIDNDLVGTDHTPGFGSAAKYVATTMQEIIRDAVVYNDNSLTVIEIMGRDAGWLTAASALGRIMGGDFPELVYLPEAVFNINESINEIQRILFSKKHVVVALAEGVKYKNGKYVGADSKEVDKFGHMHLAGASRVITHVARKKLGCKCRAVELNIMQRCSSHMISEVDFSEALMIGKEAVKMALKGYSAKMVAFKRRPGIEYNIGVTSVDIDRVANKTKTVDMIKYINKDGNNISDSLLEHIKPLVYEDNEPISNYFELGKHVL